MKIGTDMSIRSLTPFNCKILQFTIKPNSLYIQNEHNHTFIDALCMTFLLYFARVLFRLCKCKAYHSAVLYLYCKNFCVGDSCKNRIDKYDDMSKKRFNRFCFALFLNNSLFSKRICLN